MLFQQMHRFLRGMPLYRSLSVLEFGSQTIYCYFLIFFLFDPACLSLETLVGAIYGDTR